MKKIIISVFIILLLSGCSLGRQTASDAVVKFLDQYRNLSASVLTDLEEVVKKENLTEKQANSYRDALKKQYSDLKYKIINESYDGDNAEVEVKITVYDFYKVQNEASEYLINNPDFFNNDKGVYDNDLFLDYKLDKMMKNTDTVEYTLNIPVSKDEDGIWKVQELTQDDLEKIHGIYNYEM